METNQASEEVFPGLCKDLGWIWIWPRKHSGGLWVLLPMLLLLSLGAQTPVQKNKCFVKLSSQGTIDVCI